MCISFCRFIDVTDLRCFEHIPVDEGSDLSAYFKFVAANQNRPSFATIRVCCLIIVDSLLLSILIGI